MYKTRMTESRCEACGSIYKSGDVVCACNKPWHIVKSEAGDERMQDLLMSRGFERGEDELGVIWLGPMGHRVRLFSDGEWWSDKSEHESLEEYLRLQFTT